MLKDLVNVTIGEAFVVTIFSMAIVFASLLIISFILDGFKAFFHRDKKKADAVNEKSKASHKSNTNVIDNQILDQQQEDEEIVAVIAAALAASLGRPASEIKIRKIRRISQEASTWARIGRLEQMK